MPDLQSFAISLSEAVQSVLGQEVKEKFLKTPANVAPVFLRSHISSRATFPRDLDWHHQAQLICRQAATLSGSLAVLYGEEPADLHSQDGLMTGEQVSQLRCTLASF